MRLVVHTFAHPTIVAPAIGHQLRVAVCRGPFPALSTTPFKKIPSVSEHDLENAALGHTMPLLRALGPSPEDQLRAIAPSRPDRAGLGGAILCVHAQTAPPNAPQGVGKGCCRGKAQVRTKSGARDAVCLGADKIRCCLGHKEMPDCWEAPPSQQYGAGGEGSVGLDPIEIIRFWREGVYVTLVHG